MTIDQKIKVNFLKYGIVLGVILTALGIFSYYFITQMTTSPALFVAAPIMFSLFIPIVITVFLCFNGRKKIGGYWTFKQATTGIFIMFLTAYIIQFISKDMVFDKVIEPNSIVKTQLAAINAKTTISKQKGEDQKSIDKDLAEMKKDFALQKNSTVGSVIQGFVISILFVFLFALIFGSLFKKDPPVYTA
ncbi:uncharacterized protein DUF4199 [Mucilaginibacter frigoritolerans]|uniref:Uncharacterized protein DUF4199 n=1 Tax=Mucilaginibacter frigoritolerans TaxID=652788 RepID=A0A562TXS2_9SPHI|nr:DUF4199 domain-containing protein [Mucilaginibacter frigoritolerans]TWI97670.1 uncharacterized protein DUF4199 [Mucilaginibacter frigoritolerans]